MSRCRATVWAFAIAAIATVIGFQQAILWYDRRPIQEAIWFPSITFLDVNQGAMILTGLVQFPALAIVFAIAIRRWTIRATVTVITIAYAVAVGAALTINLPLVR